MSRGAAYGKYDSAGNALWTMGGFGPGFGVAADTTAVYMVGGAILPKYSDGGSELWTRTSQREYTTAAVAADAAGVYAAVRAGFRHFLAKYSSDGTNYGLNNGTLPAKAFP